MAVMTHDEFVQKFGRAPSSAPSASPAQSTGISNGVAESLGKSIGGDTGGKVGNFIDNAAQGITDFFGGNAVSKSIGTLAGYGTTLAGDALNRTKNANQYDTSAPSPSETLGSGLQLAANAIPGVGKGAGLLTKTLAGAGTGYAFDVGSNLQNDKQDPLTPGIGTFVGAGIPIAGAVLSPAKKIVDSLLKGTGSALSGAPQRAIEAIGENPQAAQEARNMVEAMPQGEQDLVKKNAQSLVQGVIKSRQQASKIYGDALESLATEDIKPAVFREQTQNFLDKYGISSAPGNRDMGNVEFSDPKNLQKASDLIDKFHNTELDGKSLRKLTDDIEAAKFKTATSDERLSFNHFLQDMADTVRGAVDKSTPKLMDMNAKYSKDMQLLEAAQNIFGQVQYGNHAEVDRTARRMENLFNQKGHDPSTVDEFLKRIGADPSAFRASEAARQMGNVEPKGNAPGIRLGEMTQAITSAVVSPKLVRDLTIATGVAGEKIQPFLEALSTPARNAVIQLLLHSQPSQQGVQTGELPTQGGTVPQQ